MSPMLGVSTPLSELSVRYRTEMHELSDYIDQTFIVIV